MAIAGASEGWTVARELAASGMWVFAEPLSDLPASFEQLAATQSNIGRMRAAGVKVAIARLGDTRYARNERQAAGNLVALRGVPGASAVSWGEALAMITSRPAEAIGMGGEIRAAERGLSRRRRAVVGRSAREQLGRRGGVDRRRARSRSPITRRRLRDRYRVLDRRDLPEAYRK